MFNYDNSHRGKFFLSLKTINKNFIQKFISSSLNSTILTININSPQYLAILDFFLFNIEGVLIFQYHINGSYFTKPKCIYYNRINILVQCIIQNIVVALNKDTKGVEKGEMFSFYKAYFNEYKIIFLSKIKMILVGVFKSGMNSNYCKLILMHLYIALGNFKQNSNDKISLLSYTYKRNQCVNNHNDNKDEKPILVDDIINKDNTNLNDNNNNNKDQFLSNNFFFSDYIELKIFERYFLKYLLIHFSKVMQIISMKRELFLNYVKLKNIYFVDMEKDKILFDYNKISKKCKKNTKYYNNKILWNYLLELSHNLEREYHKGNPRIEEWEESEKIRYYKNSSFVSFELTSTYPRLIIIIKFLPVLKGMAIIHIYSKKKLSRTLDMQNELVQGINYNNSILSHEFKNKKKYYEFKTIYFFTENSQSEIAKTYKSDGDNNIVLKYLEPEHLYNIEKFFIEFFILINRQSDLYYSMKDHSRIKYFNMEIVNQINSVSNSNREEKSIDNIFKIIDEKLKELENKNINDNMNMHIQLIKKEKKNEISSLFFINKELLFLDLFKKEKGNYIIKSKTKINNNNIRIDKHNNLFSPFKREVNEIYNKRDTFSVECDQLFKRNTNNHIINFDNSSLNKANYKKKTGSFVINDINKEQNDKTSNTSLSISKWDDYQKDDVTIALSKNGVSCINKNNISNTFISNNAIFFRHTISDDKNTKGDSPKTLSCDKRNDSEISEDNSRLSLIREKDKYKDKEKNYLHRLNSPCIDEKYNQKLINNNNNNPSQISVVKFSSLKLGKSYQKDEVSKKLSFIIGNNNNSFEHFMSFQNV